VVKVCTSSGTQGGKSRVHRDSTTLERFLGSIDRGVDLLLANRVVERRLFVLGPDTTEAADLWFSYVLSIVDLLYPTEFFVRDGVMRMDRFVAEIAADRSERPLVIGPPVLVKDAALRLRERGIRPGLDGRDGMVITAGGWKKFDDQALPRDEFTEVVADAFGLTDPTRIRDCYNAVELNTVLFECEHQAKHVPAWLHASARDPVTQRPLEPGQVGPLAFCDALPTSYPGFVLTDDLGSVSAEGACPCGRASRVLTISRRVESVEARGCALKMDRTVSR
jgi:long-chain-fatty-acid---luciferin-component ligase